MTEVHGMAYQIERDIGVTKQCMPSGSDSLTALTPMRPSAPVRFSTNDRPAERIAHFAGNQS